MFGGYDGAKCFNDIDVLDLDTMTWLQPNVLPLSPLLGQLPVLGEICGLIGV